MSLQARKKKRQIPLPLVKKSLHKTNWHLTKLILGQKSLDDWDSYMDDLKRLGLDELIEIYQGRYDRTKS